MLEEALNSKVKSLVLKFLTLNASQSYTPTEVAQYCKLSKSRVSEILHSFEESELVLALYVGKSILYNINLKNRQAKLVSKLFRTDYEESLESIKEIAEKLKGKYKGELKSVILYGDRARGAFGTQTEYELLVLTTAKTTISEPKVKIVTIDIEKFKSMVKNNDPLIMKIAVGFRTILDDGAFGLQLSEFMHQIKGKKLAFSEDGKKWDMRKISSKWH